MPANRHNADTFEPASGFDALVWALNLRIALTMSQRLVLIYLAKHANGDGTGARPSLTTLMALTGLSRRAIQYALRDLSSMGIIRQTAAFVRPTMDRKGRPAVYALSMRLVVSADLDPVKVAAAKEQETASAAPKQASIGALRDAKERSASRRSGAFSRSSDAPDLPSDLPSELPLEPSPSESAQRALVPAREGRDAVGGRTGTSVEEQFEVFWKAYPRKVGRGHARRAFEKAIRLAPLDDIVRAINVQRWDADKQFRPHPATWLNGQRWTDDPEHGQGYDGHSVDRAVIRAAGLSETDMDEGLPY